MTQLLAFNGILLTGGLAVYRLGLTGSKFEAYSFPRNYKRSVYACNAVLFCFILNRVLSPETSL